MPDMKRIKRWILPGILLALMIIAYIFELHNFVSLEALQQHKTSLQNLSAAHPVIAPIAFAVAYIASVALSLPIATFLTLLGGFLFGVIKGTLLVVISATLGASIIFMIAKTSLGKTLRDKAGALYNKVETNMNENAASYLLFLRLVPLFPFFLVNILPALFNVSLRVFFITTMIGILPGSAVYVYFGQQLGEIENASDLISTPMLLAFALLGGFALIPALYKQLRSATLNIDMQNKDQL